MQKRPGLFEFQFRIEDLSRSGDPLAGRNDPPCQSLKGRKVAPEVDFLAD